VISVVVATKGERAAELNRCIDALRNQTLKDFEVVIVIPKENMKFDLQYENSNGVCIQLIKQDAKGICNARNCGVKACKGEIIAFTDDDAEPYPDWIEKINRHFEEHPELDYIGGEFTLQTNNVWQRWIDQRYHLSEADIKRGLCHGNNMAYRRKIFDNNLFDENIMFGVDEAEFQMRLRDLGMNGMTFHDTLIRHQHRSNLFSFSKMRWGYAQGHVYLYEEKYGHSLFHWDDLMNVGFFLSTFYSLLLSRTTIHLIIFPITLLILIAIHEKKPGSTFGTWIVQIYVSLLWTVAKMYHSFKYHLRRWGVSDFRLWVWNKTKR